MTAKKNSLLGVEEARRRISAAITPIAECAQVLLTDSLGRVLGADLRSGMDVPPHANSAMDGYALASADLPANGKRDLKIAGTALAGKPYDATLRPGECIRIMTGALLPHGADCIVMQEHAERLADTIRIGTGPRRGENVRQAGEGIAKGEVILKRGKQLMPAELGLMASLGIAKVCVVRRPRVAFFSTGDELCETDATPATGQIYDSNRYTVRAMLTRLGVEMMDMGIVRDRPELLREILRKSSLQADAVISSGGASVGETDYIKQILEELGEVNFWKISMKPGKPLAYGRINQAHFFGLPGNPVSAMVTFYQFVQPALHKLMGAQEEPLFTIKVPCAEHLTKAPGRTEFQRGIIEYDSAGQMTVRTTGAQGSGILSSMSKANCFIILPEPCTEVTPGTPVTVQLFAGLI